MLKFCCLPPILRLTSSDPHQFYRSDRMLSPNHTKLQSSYFVAFMKYFVYYWPWHSNNNAKKLKKMLTQYIEPVPAWEMFFSCFKQYSNIMHRLTKRLSRNQILDMLFCIWQHKGTLLDHPTFSLEHMQGDC